VGNLAHALRTNLAVLRNALDSGDRPAAAHQLATAERLVQHHLGRARTAALAGAAATELPLRAVVEDIATALERLFADRAIDIEVLGDPALRVRCEHADLSEMLGNLMENACKWARNRVRVEVGAAPGRVFARVEDDGPGLPPAQLDAVRARGARLDEAVPGSGLGLAIVTDLATLYGGGLELSAAPPPMGGLAACLWLPAAALPRQSWAG
ncbi:MAG: ATP-binding protein, partial [Rhodospirillales bacterium]|nr:ATP-binding protein [Rhodospirillales bacterium]